MVVNASDIPTFVPDDWEIQVDGNALNQPAKFTVKPDFTADDQIISGIYGDYGFSINAASSKGTVEIALKQTSTSATMLESLSKPGTRKIVSVFLVCRKNRARYSVTSFGFGACILKPAEFTVDTKDTDRTFVFLGIDWQTTAG